MCPSLEVLTPIGPGHGRLIEACRASVEDAVRNAPGWDVDHLTIDDTAGRLGRSRARNKLLHWSTADWIFYLDADDLMHHHALARLPGIDSLDAIWGQVTLGPDPWSDFQLDHYRMIREARHLDVDHEVDWVRLFRDGPYGSLSMGHLVRGDIARATPFLEYMDEAEDFENHLCLVSRHRWKKLLHPLTVIRPWASSKGPRRATGDWGKSCWRLIMFYSRRGTHPLGEDERQRPYYWYGWSGRITGGTPTCSSLALTVG